MDTAADEATATRGRAVQQRKPEGPDEVNGVVVALSVGDEGIEGQRDHR